MKFIQINTKKALVASVELNKRLLDLDDFICFVTEPYRSKGKIAGVPGNIGKISGSRIDSRTGILFGGRAEVINVETLGTPDCTVGLLRSGTETIVLASVYLDIKLTVKPPWLQKIIDFAKKKGYSLIVGMDSNCHSTLFGPSDNSRGEELEDFIVSNGLLVENVGDKATFRTNRANILINTYIDVTLTFGLTESVRNWSVDQSFNGSDHATITFELDCPKKELDQIRNWKDGQWTRFGILADSKHLYLPRRVNNKKLDRMLHSFYKSINYALEEVCPKTSVLKSSRSFKWYTEVHKELSERVNKAYILSRKTCRNEDHETYKSELNTYKRRCRRDRNKSWNKFVECTKDVNEMAKLNRLSLIHI